MNLDEFNRANHFIHARIAPAIPHGGSLRTMLYRAEKKILGLSQFMFPSVSDWDRQAIAVGRLIYNTTRVDALLTTPSINHSIGWQLARIYDVPWIADFPDSINHVRDASPLSRLAQWRDSRRLHFIRHAASAIYVTEGELQRDRRHCRTIRRVPCTVIENGFLEEDIELAKFAMHPMNSCFILRFLGTLYPQLNLDMFLAGFERFIKVARPKVGGLSFEFVGGAHADIERIARHLEISKFVRAQPCIGSDEALRRMVASTVLVLPMHITSQSGVPGGKFYEYLRAGPAVLAVGGRDQYVIDVLNRTGAGVACHSPEETAEVLRLWYAQWLSTRHIRLARNDEAISRFSRRAGAERLAEMLSGLVTN